MQHAPASAFLTAALLLASTSQTPAQSSEPFKGRTINIVVGYSVGGGYDQYARTLARHLGKHIPGAPTIVVQNLPGAASLLAVRHLESNPAKDGTVMAMFDPGLITANITPEGVPKLDLTEFHWIGTMLRDIRVCYAWAATGVRTWQDLMARKEFLIGATARGANAYVNGAILRKVMNAPVRQIAGYPGSNEQRMAVERGELEGNCASWSALPPEWISGDKINTLLRFSEKRPPEMSQSVPYVADLTSDPETKELLTLLNAPGELGRPFIVSKQTPAHNVNQLRRAFEAALVDRDFLAEMAKQSLPLDPLRGDEADAIVRRIYDAPRALLQKAVTVLE